MSPLHSVGYCPICGGGLCGVHLCEHQAAGDHRENTEIDHGLVICDECEAIWLEPDLSSVHQYPDAVDAKCPVCSGPLWADGGRWANLSEVELLGWGDRIRRDLDRGSRPL